MLNTVDIGQFVRKQRPMNSYNPRINISHNGTALKAGISWTTLFACYFHLLGASGHWWEGIGTNYSYFYIQTEDNRFKYTVVLQTALASQCKLVQRFIKKSSKRVVLMVEITKFTLPTEEHFTEQQWIVIEGTNITSTIVQNNLSTTKLK